MKYMVLNKEIFEVLPFSYTDKTIEEIKPSAATYTFVFLRKGLAQITSEKSQLILNENELGYLPPETLYNINFSSKSNGNYLKCNYWPDITSETFPLQKITLTEKLQDYMENISTSGELADSRCIWSIYSFLDSIQNQMEENDTKNSLKIQKAINFMRENDNYSIPQLAKMCNMSESRFYVVFNESTGMTPIKMKHKIQTAKAELMLLNTDLSIDEIAHNLGFESTAHFRKIFNEHFGYSPKEARKNAK